jgi:hypothetical protein
MLANWPIWVWSQQAEKPLLVAQQNRLRGDCFLALVLPDTPTSNLREAMRASPHIRCMDLDQAIDAYVDHDAQLAGATHLVYTPEQS